MKQEKNPLARAVLDACVHAVEKGRSLDGINLDSVEFGVQKAGAVSMLGVCPWMAYVQDERPDAFWQIDLRDTRLTTGQLQVDIGSLEGNQDASIGVMLEVGADPLTGVGFAPAVHIDHGDELLLSAFEVGGRMYLRPETDVVLEPAPGGGYWVSRIQGSQEHLSPAL